MNRSEVIVGRRDSEESPEQGATTSNDFDMNQMPDWMQSLFEALCSTIEFKGMADLEARFSAPDATAWGTHLLEIRPAIMDLSDHGLTEREVAYGIIHAFDLKGVLDTFDGIEAFSFGIENDGCPRFIIEGKFEEHDVIVLIYTEPFEDSEATPLTTAPEQLKQ